MQPHHRQPVPMQNIYLLIQNELETGPYTLEELLQLPLQAKDLVWVIGQSEDWLPPLKIPALQPYLVQTEGGLEVKQEVLAAIQANRFIGHISGVPFIAVGSQRAAPSFLDTKVLKLADERHLLTDHDTKALPNYQQAQAGLPPVEPPKERLLTGSSSKPEATPPPAAGALQQPEEDEEEGGFLNKKRHLVGALVALFLFFGWLIYRHQQTAVAPSNAYTTTVAQQGPGLIPASEAIPAAQKAEATSDQLKSFKNPYADSVDFDQRLPVDLYLDSVQRVVAEQDEAQMTYAIPITRPRKYPKNSQRSYAQTTTSGPVKQQPARPISLHQQVSLQSRYLRDGKKQKLSGVEVMVKNNSRELLETVSVDVFYYKKGQKLFEKETVFFNNVYPHQTQTVSIPAHKKAISARFQLGAVTAAAKR